MRNQGMPTRDQLYRALGTPRRWLVIACRAIGLSMTFAAAGMAAVPSGSPSGTNTAHTSLIARWVKNLPRATGPKRDGLALRCFETLRHSEVIGVAHGVVIHAPAAKLISILEDYPHYQDLFEDTIKVSARSVSNGLLVSWEQKAPVVFLPNTQFVTSTLILDDMPQRKIWHSRLVSSNQLLGNDAFVAVYPLNNEQSYYWEVDFINAKWGILSTFAMGRIWTDAVAAIALADLDVKIRAENAAWTYAQTREFAKRRLDVSQIDRCVKHRVALD